MSSFTDARQLIVRMLREYEAVKYVGDALKQLEVAEKAHLDFETEVARREVELKRLQEAMSTLEAAYENKRLNHEATLAQRMASIDAPYLERKAVLDTELATKQRNLSLISEAIDARNDELKGLNVTWDDLNRSVADKRHELDRMNKQIEKLQKLVGGIGKSLGS